MFIIVIYFFWSSFMKFLKVIALGFSVIGFVSCATHNSMRGSVVMKMSPDSAHVCMGSGEVKEGDKVVAYKHVCDKSSVGHSYRNNSYTNKGCVKEKIGNGVVVKTLNDHYSEVKFDAGVPFEEGTTVEKQ
jgi:hypothetical protein